MKHLLFFFALVSLSAFGADNFVEKNTNGSDGGPVVVASTESGGVHTPKVIIASGAITLPTGAATAAKQDTAQTSLTAIAASVAAATPAGEAFIGFIGGKADVASGNFTRPNDTTAYASGDLVANSTTAGSVTPISLTVARANDATGMIRRVRLNKSGTGTTNASFRVHFYRTSPTLTNGDNGVWLSTVAGYLGACDVTIDKVFSDAAKGTGAPLVGSEINFLPTSGARTIFALVEARGAYTPAAQEVFTVEVEVLQN